MPASATMQAVNWVATRSDSRSEHSHGCAGGRRGGRCGHRQGRLASPGQCSAMTPEQAEDGVGDPLCRHPVGSGAAAVRPAAPRSSPVLTPEDPDHRCPAALPRRHPCIPAERWKPDSITRGYFGARCYPAPPIVARFVVALQRGVSVSKPGFWRPFLRGILNRFGHVAGNESAAFGGGSTVGGPVIRRPSG